MSIACSDENEAEYVAEPVTTRTISDVDDHNGCPPATGQNPARTGWRVRPATTGSGTSRAERARRSNTMASAAPAGASSDAMFTSTP